MTSIASRFALRLVVDISVWHPAAAEWQFLLRLLPAGEAQAVQRFRFRDDQKRALISKLLQRHCVSQLLGEPFERVAIARTRGKKPFYAGAAQHLDAPNFNFNVSHEGDYVVLASEPETICGVDVAAPQQLRRQKAEPVESFFANFERQFTGAEWAAIRGAGEDDESKEAAFRQHWSLKEALVKVRGDGVEFDFGRAGFCIRATAHGGSHRTATVQIDGVEQPRWPVPGAGSAGRALVSHVQSEDMWRFFLQELRGGHWVSVARGPPEVIVDAWGEFTKSLRRRNMSESEWQGALNKPSPPFSLLSVADLVPHERRSDFVEAGGEDS